MCVQAPFKQIEYGGVWGSYDNQPKAIFYLLNETIGLRVGHPGSRTGLRLFLDCVREPDPEPQVDLCNPYFRFKASEGLGFMDFRV